MLIFQKGSLSIYTNVHILNSENYQTALLIFLYFPIKKLSNFFFILLCVINTDFLGNNCYFALY